MDIPVEAIREAYRNSPIDYETSQDAEVSMHGGMKAIQRLAKIWYADDETLPTV